MTQFLTPKIEEVFNTISLDCTFPNALKINETLKQQIISTEAINHYKILKKWLEEGLILYDEEADNLAKDIDVFFAAKRLATLGNMLVHLSKYTTANFNIFYLPFSLQEYQKLRLRLWIEFLEKQKLSYKIDRNENKSSFDKKFIFYEETNEIHSFLKEEQILEDDYIRHLIKKFPNYEERMIYG